MVGFITASAGILLSNLVEVFVSYFLYQTYEVLVPDNSFISFFKSLWKYSWFTADNRFLMFILSQLIVVFILLWKWITIFLRMFWNILLPTNEEEWRLWQMLNIFWKRFNGRRRLRIFSKFLSHNFTYLFS